MAEQNNLEVEDVNQKDRVNEKTYVIIGISSILLCLLGFIVQFVVIKFLDNEFDNEVSAIHQTILIVLAVVFIIFILFTLTFSGIRNKTLKPGNLYLLFLLVAIIIFTFINYTGGLTNSPFTSMYAGLMTLTFLIYEKPKAVFFSFGVIVICLLVNVLLQIYGKVNLINTNILIYKCIYGTITVLLFVVLTGIDYLSKNYKRIKFITDFFKESNETRS